MDRNTIEELRNKTTLLGHSAKRGIIRVQNLDDIYAPNPIKVDSDKVIVDTEEDLINLNANKKYISKKIDPELEQERKEALSKKHLHSGHRKRMNQRVRFDPDFEGFAPHEMLEFLLYIGVPRVDTNELAHRIIQEFGSFSKVFYAPVDELLKVKGLTERAAFTIASVLPIARWVSIQNRNGKRFKIEDTDSAVRFLRPYFANKLVENVYIVCIDSADYVVNIFPISKGSSNMAVIDARQIINKANSSMASKVILAHNHPAGTLMPSQEDVNATSQVAIGLSSISITLVDHLIFIPTGDEVFSFYASEVLADILYLSDEIVGGNTLNEVYSLFEVNDLVTLNSRYRCKQSGILKNIYDNMIASFDKQ